MKKEEDGDEMRYQDEADNKHHFYREWSFSGVNFY